MSQTMKRHWILLPAASLLAALGACGDDASGLGDATGSGAGSSRGGGSQGGAGADGVGGASDGGSVSVCAGDCTVQCDSVDGTPSAGECIGDLGGAFQCNPVTNEGCDSVTGEACDFGPAGFECYPAPNDQSLCEACGPTGPHCRPGSTCSTFNACAKFCCTDADCGNGGSCRLDPGFGVGLCQAGGGPTGTGTGTDTGTGTGTGTGSGTGTGMGGMGGVGGIVVGGMGGAGGA